MDPELVTTKIESAFEKFRTNDGVDPKEARIEIYMVETEKDSGSYETVTFNLFSGNKFVRYVSIQEDILDILFDPFNKVAIITQFLFNFLITYAQKKNYEPTDCTINISKDITQNKMKAIFSTKEGKIHELTFEEIFSAESQLG